MADYLRGTPASRRSATISQVRLAADAGERTITSNCQALLHVIAYAEGTSTSPATRCDGYDVIVTGEDGRPEVFTDFSTHPFAKGRPSKVIRPGLTSNASGRYQFMLLHYSYYKKELDLPNFGPEAQDRWAVRLISERHALRMIDAGEFEEAIRAIAPLWASLPGANYKDQNMRKLGELKDAYLRFGGVLA